jgi:hypothetical protein
MQMEGQGHLEKWQCELQGTDAVNAGRTFVDLEGLEEEELKYIKSGENTLYSEFAVIANGKVKIPKGAAKSIGQAAARSPATKGKAKNNKGASKNKRNLTPNVDAPRKVLAVRIIAKDSATSSSVVTMGNEIFGSSGKDVVNLRERFQTCSYGAMLMEPFEGTTTTGQTIAGGVIDIGVDTYVIGASNRNVENAAVTALTALLGDLPSQFDHVMLCLPPGTAGNWIAYGKRIL